MSSSPVDVASFANLDDTSSESSIGSASSNEDRGSDGQDEAESVVIVKNDDPPSSNSSSASSGLSSLGSLEDSLGLRKGLSNHYIGKSRSFANLMECSEGDAGDLAKPENPFNKRRRVQIQSRFSYMRRASCSAIIMKELPPLSELKSADREEEEEEVVKEEEEEEKSDVSSEDDDESGAPARSGGGFNAPRSFALFDELDN